MINRFLKWYDTQDKADQMILLGFILMEIAAGILAIGMGLMYAAVAALGEGM